jgi:hypothetical protein
MTGDYGSWLLIICLLCEAEIVRLTRCTCNLKLAPFEIGPVVFDIDTNQTLPNSSQTFIILVSNVSLVLKTELNRVAA